MKPWYAVVSNDQYGIVVLSKHNHYSDAVRYLSEWVESDPSTPYYIMQSVEKWTYEPKIKKEFYGPF